MLTADFNLKLLIIACSWPGYGLAKEAFNGDSKACSNSKSGLLLSLYPQYTMPFKSWNVLNIFCRVSCCTQTNHIETKLRSDRLYKCLSDFSSKAPDNLKAAWSILRDWVEARLHVLKVVSSCGQKTPKKRNLTSPNQCSKNQRRTQRSQRCGDGQCHLKRFNS